MFDPLDTCGAAPVDAALVAAEVAVIARVLASEAAAPVDAGADEPRSAVEVLRRQALVGEQLTRMAQTRSLRAVAGLVEELRGEDTARAGVHGSRMGEFVADQMAAVLGVSRRIAELRIEDALALTDRLPKTLAALEAGFLSAPVAHVLVRETENATLHVAGEVEARVLDALGRGLVEGLGRFSVDEIDLCGRLETVAVAAVAVRATASVVRTLARRALTSLDGDAVRAQRAANRDARDIDTWAGQNGMRWVGAQLPEAHAAAVCDRIERAARSLATNPEETRTLGQLRADVFTDRLLGDPSLQRPTGLDDGGGPSTAVHLQVTVDRTGQLNLGRFGPVGPEALTDLLALSSATGGRVTIAEVSEQACPGVHDTPGRYRPSAALVAAVIARDVTCRFPGCAVPGSVCDLDHTVPHPHGPTCICNLGCLCRHHHRLKTLGDWVLTHHGDGHFTWRDPTGRTYDVWPDHPPPDRQ